MTGSRPLRLTVGVSATLLALVMTLVVGGCGGGSVADGPSGSTSAVPVPTSAGEAPTTTVDPATLPQTDERPAATGEGLDGRAAALWNAVVADDPVLALPAFFPLAAYQQVKAVKDPAADWHDRLLTELESDVHALHGRLGADASVATFAGLSVPDAAVWVTPGQEHNRLPYWRVYGSTLGYSVDGVAHSLPVGSLISWRGQWYVVHLGAIR